MEALAEALKTESEVRPVESESSAEIEENEEEAEDYPVDKDEEEEEEAEEEEEEINWNLTFSEQSIINLVSSLEGKCLMLAMYLNVPTTTLVYLKHTVRAQGLQKSILDRNIMLYWLALRAASPNKKKAKELAKALRACGLDDIADSVMPTLLANQMFKSLEEIRQESKRKAEEENEN